MRQLVKEVKKKKGGSKRTTKNQLPFPPKRGRHPISISHLAAKEGRKGKKREEEIPRSSGRFLFLLMRRRGKVPGTSSRIFLGGRKDGLPRAPEGKGKGKGGTKELFFPQKRGKGTNYLTFSFYFTYGGEKDTRAIFSGEPATDAY